MGSTDSERAFCWLLHMLEQRLPARHATPSWTELAPLIIELAEEVSAHGPFNFPLSDGQALYAYCSTRLHWLARGQAGHPYATVRLVDADLTMDLDKANRPDDRMVLVATEPLTHGEPWQAMARGELHVFVDGRPVWHRAGFTPARTAGPEAKDATAIAQAAQAAQAA